MPWAVVQEFEGFVFVAETSGVRNNLMASSYGNPLFKRLTWAFLLCD